MKAINNFKKFDYIVENYTEIILKVIHYHFNKPEYKFFVMECYNDILLVLWNNIDKIEKVESSKAFIVTISKNKSIDYLRKLNNLGKKEVLKDEIEGENEKTIEKEYLEKVSLERISTFIKGLKVIDKTIFIEKFISEKTARDISLITGIKVITIYKRLERLREELKIFIEKEEYKDGQV